MCQWPGTTADHIKPRAQGGTDADENMQALCKTCHAAKSGRRE
jgi:5-methylcytosine-specific restriction protein A